MFSLPRGVWNATENVPLASAAWEDWAVVEQLAYPGGGALLLGAIPAAENFPVLLETYTQAAQAMSAISRAVEWPPARRAGLSRQLNRMGH
jgi:hypothetical protein